MVAIDCLRTHVDTPKPKESGELYTVSPRLKASRKDKTIRLSDLNTLRRADLIPADRYAAAAYAIRDKESWSIWALRVLMALGTGHVLAGVIFFFAFNWADMSNFAKFAVLQGGIVLSALAALLAGLDRPVGQALLIAASVLTGVVLAVFGQIYQTGADAYQLFTGWSLLILPWVLVSRNAAHWLVWLIVVTLGLYLYCRQILAPLQRIDQTDIFLLVGTFLAAALFIREMAIRLGATWLDANWFRYAVLFAALGCFFSVAIVYLFGIDGTLPVLLAFAVALIASLGVYRFLLPDFGAFAIATGYGGFYAMACGGRFIGEIFGYDTNAFTILFALAFLTAWCVGVTTGMGRLLIALRRVMREEAA